MAEIRIAVRTPIRDVMSDHRMILSIVERSSHRAGDDDLPVTRRVEVDALLERQPVGPGPGTSWPRPGSLPIFISVGFAVGGRRARLVDGPAAIGSRSPTTCKSGWRSVLAVHRELVNAAKAGGPPAPRRATLQRAVERDVLPDDRAGLAGGEHAPRTWMCRRPGSRRRRGRGGRTARLRQGPEGHF